jgi:hypothetical protein
MPGYPSIEHAGPWLVTAMMMKGWLASAPPDTTRASRCVLTHAVVAVVVLVAARDVVTGRDVEANGAAVDEHPASAMATEHTRGNHSRPVHRLVCPARDDGTISMTPTVTSALQS